MISQTYNISYKHLGLMKTLEKSQSDSGLWYRFIFSVKRNGGLQKTLSLVAYKEVIDNNRDTASSLYSWTIFE